MLIDAACMPALHMLAQTMRAIYSSTVSDNKVNNARKTFFREDVRKQITTSSAQKSLHTQLAICGPSAVLTVQSNKIPM